jgi:hypothetical protein
MIDPNMLRQLGWSEDLIGEVVRTSEAIGPQPSFLDGAYVVPSQMFVAGSGNSFVVESASMELPREPHTTNRILR